MKRIIRREKDLLKTANNSDEFHNVTYDLLQHGFPNVLAMSMSIMDYYVIKFASDFYSKINKGNL